MTSPFRHIASRWAHLAINVLVVCGGSVGCAGPGLIDRWSGKQALIWRSLTDTAYAQARHAGTEEGLHHPEYAAGWRAGYYETLASGEPISEKLVDPAAELPPTAMSQWLGGFAAGRRAASASLRSSNERSIEVTPPDAIIADLRPPMQPRPEPTSGLAELPESPALQPVAKQAHFSMRQPTLSRDDSRWIASPRTIDLRIAAALLEDESANQLASGLRPLPTAKPPAPRPLPADSSMLAPPVRLGPPRRSPF